MSEKLKKKRSQNDSQWVSPLIVTFWELTFDDFNDVFFGSSFALPDSPFDGRLTTLLSDVFVSTFWKCEIIFLSGRRICSCLTMGLLFLQLLWFFTISMEANMSLNFVMLLLRQLFSISVFSLIISCKINKKILITSFQHWARVKFNFQDFLGSLVTFEYGIWQRRAIDTVNALGSVRSHSMLTDARLG